MHDHHHHHIGLNLDNVETEILPCFVPLYGRLYGPIESSFLRMGGPLPTVTELVPTLW